MLLIYVLVLLSMFLLVLLILVLRDRKQIRGLRELRLQQDSGLISRDSLLKEREEQLRSLRTQESGLQERLLQLSSRVAGLEVENKHLLEQLRSEGEKLRSLQEQFRADFEVLANGILEQKSQKFTQQNQENLSNLLLPLRERLRDFEKRVEDTYNSEARERHSLKQEVSRLFELNQTLSREARDLANALKTDSKLQGNWGEFILERVLEISGLEKNIHYRLQESRRDEDGEQFRPDAVLLLPEDRHLIIDSKVSLSAYNRFREVASPEEQEQALRAHLQSIRQHIQELGSKNYERLYENSAGFVIMFVPVEPAYSLALQQDGDLYSEAYRKKIILVSVSGLLATLHLIHSMWTLEKQNRNASEIIRQGTDLYEKLVGFTEDLQDLGKFMDRARGSYEEAVKKLSTGRGNLLIRAERMKGLGLNPKKNLSLPAGQDFDSGSLEPEDS